MVRVTGTLRFLGQALYAFACVMGIGGPLLELSDRVLNYPADALCRAHHFDGARFQQCFVRALDEAHGPDAVMIYYVPLAQAADFELEALNAHARNAQPLRWQLMVRSRELT